MADQSTADPRIEALAEAWASIDGRAERFRADRDDPNADRIESTYGCYMIEADEMLERLEARGFTIVRIAEATDA